MKIGFIGLGIMGAPMAGHLLAAGHELFVNTHGVPPKAITGCRVRRCAPLVQRLQRMPIS